MSKFRSAGYAIGDLDLCYNCRHYRKNHGGEYNMGKCPSSTEAKAEEN